MEWEGRCKIMSKKVERNAIPTIEFKSTEADMGCKNETKKLEKANKRAIKKEEKKAKPKMSKKKKRLILIIVLVCVLIVAAGYTVFIAPLLEKEQWIYKETSVERGTLTVGVSESGSLEYGITNVLYDLNLDVSDDDEDEEEEEETVQKYLEIEEVYVAAGQQISTGDTLVKFTEDSVESVRKLLQSALVDAQVDYNEALSEYNLSALEAKTNYEIQKVNETYANSIYSSASSTINNQINLLQVQITKLTAQIGSLEEAITEAQEDYADAKETYDAAKASYDADSGENTVNFMTVQKTYLSAQTQFQSAESTLTRAQDALTENAKEIESLNTQLSTANAQKAVNSISTEQEYQDSVLNGEYAQISYDAQIETLQETLKESEVAKTDIEDQIAAFEEFVGEEGILYAAEDGLITEVNYEAEDELTTTGTILAYAIADDLTIAVDVTQEDVVTLTVGDPVDIVFSAYEDETYSGNIASIDTTATSEDSLTVSYNVVIHVEGSLDVLYGGMTADITFVTEEKEDILYISRKAIVEENGKKYVYAATTLGGKELIEVETGVTNGLYVEIISGLEEGDTIYIASQVSSEEEVADTEIDSSSNTSTETSNTTEGSFDMEGNSGSFGTMPDFNSEGGGFGGEMPSGANFGGGMEAQP